MTNDHHQRADARRPFFAAALAALVGLCVVAGAAWAQGDEVVEFKGSSSTVTPEFEVQAPWIIDWRAFSDFPQSMFIEISLLDSTTGLHQGVITETRDVGTGVKMFSESGAFKLRINSDLVRWQVLVKELTEEEAARYTPKKREGVLSDEWFRNKGD